MIEPEEFAGRLGDRLLAIMRRVHELSPKGVVGVEMMPTTVREARYRMKFMCVCGVNEAGEVEDMREVVLMISIQKLMVEEPEFTVFLGQMMKQVREKLGG